MNCFLCKKIFINLLELESLLMPGWMEDAVAVGRGRNLVVIGAAVSVVVVDSEIGAELDGTSEGGEEEVDLLVHWINGNLRERETYPSNPLFRDVIKKVEGKLLLLCRIRWNFIGLPPGDSGRTGLLSSGGSCSCCCSGSSGWRIPRDRVVHLSGWGDTRKRFRLGGRQNRIRSPQERVEVWIVDEIWNGVLILKNAASVVAYLFFIIIKKRHLEKWNENVCRYIRKPNKQGHYIVLWDGDTYKYTYMYIPDYRRMKSLRRRVGTIHSSRKRRRSKTAGHKLGHLSVIIKSEIEFFSKIRVRRKK